MGRLKNLFFTIITSFEIIVIVLIFLFHNIFIDYSEAFGAQIKMMESPWKQPLLITSSLFVYAFIQVRQIIFPLKSSNKVLINWPDYQLLKDRAYFGLFIVICAVIPAVYVFIFGQSATNGLISLATLLSILPPLVSGFTMYIAHNQINEILDS